MPLSGRPVAAFLGQCALILAAGLALMAVFTALLEPTPDAIVFGSPAKTLSFLADSDTRIIEVNANYLVVHGKEPGFVKSLYANGAWLVLPAPPGGCMTLATYPPK